MKKKIFFDSYRSPLGRYGFEDDSQNFSTESKSNICVALAISGEAERTLRVGISVPESEPEEARATVDGFAISLLLGYPPEDVVAEYFDLVRPSRPVQEAAATIEPANAKYEGAARDNNGKSASSVSSPYGKSANLRNSSLADDRLETIAAAVVKDTTNPKKAEKSRWRLRTGKQARTTYRLFHQFVSEMFQVDRVPDLRQEHFFAFKDFLSNEIYRYHGKSDSERERHCSIEEMRAIARTKPKALRGICSSTVARHFSHLRQFLEYAESKNIDVDGKISFEKLCRRGRGRKTRAVRSPQIYAENC